MTPNKLNTEATPQSHTLEALKQLLPACFTEVKNERGELQQVVDWDALKQLLGENIADGNNEHYQFTWAGKQAARLEANKVTSQTLRPIPEDSVGWDTTENLYIEGDNLQVLKLLQQGYMGKVKIIYIDPPYNTGNDFVYDDNFARTQAEEDLSSGDIDEEGNRYRKNNRTNGRFHSDWCSMIYPRLLIARSLLTEDGVIFISIDDNEVHNLRKICDEVFGEENFVATLILITNPRGSQSSKYIAKTHEYVLCFSKNIDRLELLGLRLSDEQKKEFNKRDTKGFFREIGLRKRGADSRREDSPSLYYPIYFDIATGDISTTNKYDIEILPKLSNGTDGRWRWSSEKVERDKEFLLVRTVKRDGIEEYDIFTKDYLTEEKKRKVMSLWDEKGNNNEFATELVGELFGSGGLFDYPKSLYFLKKVLEIGSNPDSLILDFFSGSATTAHAVMQLNAEDGGKRKYICVQLNEATPEDSEARKAGYASIPEIAKERIRRAGQKIKAENPTAQNLDTGFRVLRLADSNFNEVNRHPNEYDQVQLDLFATNIKEDRNDLDLLFEAMLSWGVPLSLPISTAEIDGCRLYNVNDGDLVACFAENVSEAVVKAMASKVSLRVLFRDSCFSEDKHKINIFEIFKQQLGWDEKEAMDKIRVI